MNVKPILKKLSHSEKSSLDLDRGWEEQDVSQQASWAGGGGVVGGGGGVGVYYDLGGSVSAAAGSSGRTAGGRDVTFAFSSTDNISSTLGGSGAPRTSGKFQHARSASGTSHMSVATTGSGAGGGHAVLAAAAVAGGRGASFVHPFQQLPRTSTPPVSYANSLASFDPAKDYSPTITEAEDDDGPPMVGGPFDSPYAHFVHTTATAPTTAATTPHGPSSLRRPSLASSQRTSSFSDIAPVKDMQGQPLQPTSSSLSAGQQQQPGGPQLRINTSAASTTPGPSGMASSMPPTMGSRSFSGPSSSSAGGVGPRRLPHALLGSASRSDLNLHGSAAASSVSGLAILDSPASTTLASPLGGGLVGGSGLTPPREPMSPLRTSLDAPFAGGGSFSSGSKLRQGSGSGTRPLDAESAAAMTRADHIRQARRKFEERERAKEEKYAREQVRRRERRDTTAGRSAAGSMSSGSGSGNGAGLSMSVGGMGSGAGVGLAGSGSGGTDSRKGSGTFTFTTTTEKRDGCSISIHRSNREGEAAADAEKQAAAQADTFLSRNYESVPEPQSLPTFGSTASAGSGAGAAGGGSGPGRGYHRPRRTNTAKKKTHGAWTMFILWLRTTLLRMGRR